MWQQDVVSALQVVFECEVILNQYCIEKKRLDPCLPKYKLRIEFDEYNHERRGPTFEQSKQ